MSLHKGKPVLQYDPSRLLPLKKPAEYTWQLGPITFKVVHGDIFTVPTDAMVNSEQTDFKLGSDPSSVSGKLARSPHGRHIQRSLDKQMGDNVKMDLGTILQTTGGDICDKIYHAGFHDAKEWTWSNARVITIKNNNSNTNNPVQEQDQEGHDDDHDDDNPEERATDHLAVIRSCVREILEVAYRDNAIHSVAFPLIGTGVFDLDHSLVANDFFREVVQFALQVVPSSIQEQQEPGVMEVWLVLYDEYSFHVSVESGVQAWLSYLASSSSSPSYRLLRPRQQQWEPLRLGVPFLDQFEEEQLVKETHPKFSAWMNVRFAELILGYAVAVLLQRNSVTPMAVVNRARPVTFGGMRQMAKQLVANIDSSGCSSGDDGDVDEGTTTDTAARLPNSNTTTNDWYDFLLSVLTKGVQDKILEAINHDRNSIAHGRQSRPANDIRHDICTLLNLPVWKGLSQKHRPANHLDLFPWLALQPPAADDSKEATTTSTTTTTATTTSVGVFEKWTDTSLFYVVPWSGAHFVVPRTT